MRQIWIRFLRSTVSHSVPQHNLSQHYRRPRPWHICRKRRERGVHNVLFENITMTGTLRGPRIKAERGRGGTVSNITFRDVKAANVTTGISVNMEYQQGIPPTNATATPVFQNFVFERISFTGRGTAGEFIGLPESPLINLSLVDVTFPQDAAFGECKHVIGSYCTGTTNRCPPCFESKY